jgi:hypothetical protein
LLANYTSTQDFAAWYAEDALRGPDSTDCFNTEAYQYLLEQVEEGRGSGGFPWALAEFHKARSLVNSSGR